MPTKALKMKSSDYKLRELVKQGTHILNEIKAVEDTIELTKDSLTKFELIKAKNDLQQQFNDIFDKVFSGEVL